MTECTQTLQRQKRMKIGIFKELGSCKIICIGQNLVQKCRLNAYFPERKLFPLKRNACPLNIFLMNFASIRVKQMSHRITEFSSGCENYTSI